MLEALRELLPAAGDLDRARGRALRLGDAARLHRHRPTCWPRRCARTSPSSPAQAAYVDGRGSQLDAAQLLRRRRGRDPRGHPPDRQGDRRAGRRSTRRSPASTACRPAGADAGSEPRRPAGDVAAASARRPRRGDEGRGAQGRAVAGARRLAALGRAGRGRAARARPRGRRARRRRRPGRAAQATSGPTSPSSPCTGPAARTAPSRSCSRSSASPTPGPGVARLRALHGQGRWPSTRCARPGSRRPTGSPSTQTAFRELGAADALERDRGAARLPAGGQAGRGRARRSGSVRRPRATRSRQALVAAFSYDDRVLLERYVDGRELAVSVLDGEPLPVVEAIPERGRPLQLRGPLRDRPHRLRLPGRARPRRGRRRSASVALARLARRSAARASRAST